MTLRRRSRPRPRSQRQENRLVLRLMIANVLNGAGVGATGPLIAYWFAVRFGQGPAEIGPLLAAGFLMAAVASVATGWLSKYLGIVRSVVAMRLVGLAMLIALPFAPSFGVAGALYVLRGMFNRGTTGARSALSISIVRAATARVRGQHGKRFDAGAAVGQSAVDRDTVRGR